MSSAQFIKRIPKSDSHILPVIQASAPQRLIINQEAKGLNKVQVRLCRKTEASDIACIWRDFRFDKNNVKHRLLQGRQHRD